MREYIIVSVDSEIYTDEHTAESMRTSSVGFFCQQKSEKSVNHMNAKPGSDLRTIQRKIAEEFRLIDDSFFNQVFQNNEQGIQLLLRTILDRIDLNIVSVETQHFIKNLWGRSVRMDVYAVDDCGVRYNIEIQRGKRDGKPERARYYSSILDANIVPSGGTFPNLPKTYIVFITEGDVIGNGRQINEIKRTTASGDSFEDGSHILYVDALHQDDSPVGRLMHDLFCVHASDMYDPQLAEWVRYYKETEDGVQIMCAVMERACAETAIFIYRRRYGLSDEEIIERMMEDFSITHEEAAAYVMGSAQSSEGTQVFGGYHQ